MDAVPPDASTKTPPAKAKRGLWSMGPPLAVIPLIFAPLVVFAVLVGMGVFMLVGVIDDANVGKTMADVKTLEAVIIRYKTSMSILPSSLEDLVRRPANASDQWRKMIEDGLLKDAWGQPYQYRNPGRHNPNSYDIYSPGPDMKEDTEDDIGNWQD